jgi:hypothetical protein
MLALSVSAGRRGYTEGMEEKRMEIMHEKSTPTSEINPSVGGYHPADDLGAKALYDYREMFDFMGQV